jgi:hypothetical protein
VTWGKRLADGISAGPWHRVKRQEFTTHLFEEPGTLEEVSRLAAAWCRRYLAEEGADTPSLAS